MKKKIDGGRMQILKPILEEEQVNESEFYECLISYVDIGTSARASYRSGGYPYLKRKLMFDSSRKLYRLIHWIQALRYHQQ